jgi:transcriptional regulator GlxA family with amidase domain
LPGVDVAVLARLASEHDAVAVLRELEGALRALGARPGSQLALIGAVMERIASDTEIQRVEDVALAFDVSVRSLQRLFRTHVGVSPKWVIRRVRLKEAAARAESGALENWAQLAIALGYFDQSHLVNDFTSLVGRPPSDYMRSLTPR